VTLSVFDFKDYRVYLDEAIKLKRSENSSLSFRLISKKIGYSSPNFILLVIQGKRNLTSESIKKISQFLELKTNEKEYFKNLVFLNQSESFEDKLEFSKKLLSTKSASEKTHLTQDLLNYYSSWINIVIREMTLLNNFKADPDWIQKKIHTDVNTKEIKEALQTLINLQLLQKTEQNSYKAVHVDLKTPDELKSEFVRAFHYEMVNKAIQTFTTVDKEFRDITSITVPISIELLPEIKKKISEFRHSIAEAAKNNSQATDVFQLNIQLFPLTKPEIT
jgi:uncharacterized protein (TIGR02147 family)